MWSARETSTQRVVSILAMSLAVLVFAARSVRAEVFPEPLCKNLPAVNPEVKAWVARVAPELAQVPVRELPEKTALDVFDRAAAAGWGGIDILTHDAFREPCTFHFSREALRAVDAAFDLDLLPPTCGHDTTGQAFEMAAILAGRGKLVVFYDRDRIAYRSEQHGREFRLASRVEFDTPVAGALEHIQGLCAKVLLLGCVRVRSMVKDGRMVEVRAGTFTLRSPLKPIQARRTAPEARGCARGALPTDTAGVTAAPSFVPPSKEPPDPATPSCACAHARRIMSTLGSSVRDAFAPGWSRDPFTRACTTRDRLLQYSVPFRLRTGLWGRGGSGRVPVQSGSKDSAIAENPS